MAVLPILTQESPILRQKAKRVPRVDSSIRKLIDDMVDTMVAAPGVGLAAPQVGVGLRVCVIKTDTNLHTLVNPEMVKWEGEQVGLEGCLSIPGYVGEVKRHMQVVALCHPTQFLLRPRAHFLLLIHFLLLPLLEHGLHHR